MERDSLVSGDAENACEVSPMSVCVQVTCRPDQSHGRQVISGAVESGEQVLANECQRM